MTKLHYFDQPEADADDFMLQMAKEQGYVPSGCLLGGAVVMSETTEGRKACWGCNGPRERCGGDPKREVAALRARARANPSLDGR